MSNSKGCSQALQKRKELTPAWRKSPGKPFVFKTLFKFEKGGSQMRWFMCIIVPLVLLLAACGAPEAQIAPTTAPVLDAASSTDSADPCGPDALQKYRVEYIDALNRWGSTSLVAGQASLNDLPTSITSLKSIVNELSAVRPPDCAADAHAETIAAMQMSIGGYEDLLAKKNVGTTLTNAIDKLALARAKVAALPGTPVPVPTAAATYTPLPTLTAVPTTAPTATPMPTATPQPRQAVMASRTQMYETPTSNAPIKTIAKDTQVLTFETMKGRVHIRVDNVDGWVGTGSVIIK